MKAFNTTYQTLTEASEPKNRNEKKVEKVVNRQDDNSYDELMNDVPKKNNDSSNQADTNKDFEYADSGEFVDDTQLSDTNPKDEYL